MTASCSFLPINGFNISFVEDVINSPFYFVKFDSDSRSAVPW